MQELLTVTTHTHEPGPTEAPAATSDAGFTLVELAVVLLILGIVMAICSSVVFSLSNSARRNDSMVTTEQAASTALAVLARDIRSAHSISFPGTSPNQVQLQVNNGSGGYVYVEWTYDSTALTVTRSTATSAAGPFTKTGPTATNVTNGASGIFRYYNVLGADISSATNNTIKNCAARIGVQLDVSSSTIGVPTFQASEDVSLTDQVQIISAPGNGQC